MKDSRSSDRAGGLSGYLSNGPDMNAHVPCIARLQWMCRIVVSLHTERICWVRDSSCNLSLLRSQSVRNPSGMAISGELISMRMLLMLISR